MLFLVVEVSCVGGLGVLGLGVLSLQDVVWMMQEIWQWFGLGWFGVNLFCYWLVYCDFVCEVGWLEFLVLEFVWYGVVLFVLLYEIYFSFLQDDDMLVVVIVVCLVMISFYFGLFDVVWIVVLCQIGVVLMVSVILFFEVYVICDVGLDVIIVQGFEVGGYCGIFDLDGLDVCQLVMDLMLGFKGLGLLLIVVGGIMIGVDVVYYLWVGVVVVQMGMVFLVCLELVVGLDWCVRLWLGCMVMICVILGCLVCGFENCFVVLGMCFDVFVLLDYLVVYDVVKVLYVVVGGLDYVV